MVKNLPAMQDAQVRSLGQEDPLEESMVNNSSILAWRIPWTEDPGGLQSMLLQRVGQCYYDLNLLGASCFRHFLSDVVKSWGRGDDWIPFTHHF